MADAALVLRARGGDELAFRRLLDQHQDLIGATAARYFGPGLERDDLRQEARHGFYKAVRDYKPDRGVGFSTFAKGCVERQVITAVKTAQRHKHSPLNDAALFSTPVDHEHASELGDLFVDPRAPDPIVVLQAKEDVNSLLAAVGDLSELERQALVGLAQGDSYQVIAAALHADIKSIDNALQRARRKLAAAIVPSLKEAA